MNLYRHELRVHLKSLFIWGVIVGMLVWIGMTKYAAYADNPSMLAIIDAMPQTLIDALNMRAFNLTTLNGFLGVLFLYLGLLGAMAAGLWGGGVLADEERFKTAEFLLTMPVSRIQVIMAKALAALTLSLLFVLITWGVTLLIISPYDPAPEVYAYLARLMMSMAMIELIFLAAGLMLAAILPWPRRVGGAMIGVILTAYYLAMVSGLNEKLHFLRYFTPFKYFDAGELLHQGGVSLAFWALAASIIVGSISTAFWAYNRRDMAL